LDSDPIVIRRAEPEDFEAVWRTMKDEEAYSGLLQLPFPSREMWRRRMAEHGDHDYVLLACVKDEVVGNAGLHAAGNSPRRAHAMKLGLAVHRDWQGKGVGNALLGAICGLADNWLNVFRLELTVYTDNERAIALYRKHGFEVEGTHKAYALRAGRYVDSFAMARVRPKPPAV
jgi:L-phenylalanine/L-methionine N-acetyltransferase